MTRRTLPTPSQGSRKLPQPNAAASSQDSIFQQFQEINRTLNQQIADLKEKEADLNGQIEILQAQKNTQELANIEQKSRIEALEIEKQRLVENKEDVNKIRESLGSEIKEISETNEKLRKEVLETYKTLQQSQESLGLVQKELSDYARKADEEIAELKAENTDLGATNEQLTNAIEELTKQLAIVKSKAERQDAAMLQMKSATVGEQKSFKERENYLLRQIDELNSQQRVELERAQATIELQKRQIETLRSSNESSELGNKTLSTLISEMQQQQERDAREIEQLREEKRVLERKLAQNEKVVAKQGDEYAALRRQLESTQAKISEITKNAARYDSATVKKELQEIYHQVLENIKDESNLVGVVVEAFYSKKHSKYKPNPQEKDAAISYVESCDENAQKNRAKIIQSIALLKTQFDEVKGDSSKEKILLVEILEKFQKINNVIKNSFDFNCKKLEEIFNVGNLRSDKPNFMMPDHREVDKIVQEASKNASQSQSVSRSSGAVGGYSQGASPRQGAWGGYSSSPYSPFQDFEEEQHSLTPSGTLNEVASNARLQSRSQADSKPRY